MKKFIKYFKAYFDEQNKLSYYTFILILIGVIISLEYTYNIDRQFITPLKSSFIHYPALVLWYGIPFLMSIAAYSYFYKKDSAIFRKSLMAGAVILLFYAFNEWFYFHKPLIENLFHSNVQYYIRRCTTNAVSAFTYLFPAWIYWRIYDKDQPYYGLSYRNFDFKPYGFMLLIMMPIVFIAALTPDFTSYYPSFKTGQAEEHWGIPTYWLIPLFELAYGLDFVGTEVFFRGFMIILLAKHIGRGAVIPMVVFYVMIHFGKPLGETISSMVGGFILGVLAYETRSVWGGIIVHIGIAYAMEIFAFLKLAQQ